MVGLRLITGSLDEGYYKKWFTKPLNAIIDHLVYTQNLAKKILFTSILEEKHGLNITLRIMLSFIRVVWLYVLLNTGGKQYKQAFAT